MEAEERFQTFNELTFGQAQDILREVTQKRNCYGTAMLDWDCDGCPLKPYARYDSDFECFDCVKPLQMILSRMIETGVEVVRCQDCKFGTLSERKGDPYIRCHKNPKPLDGFCHEGVRK